MTIIHICDGWEPSNGAANIARLIAQEQKAAGCEVSFRRWAGWRELRSADEAWIHCGWKPCLWWAALATTLFRKKNAIHSSTSNLHWMPEACHDPMRLKYHGWKKMLVGPIERFCLRRCDVLVATCEAEADWIRNYLTASHQSHRSLAIPSPSPKIEITDIKRFFKMDAPIVRPRENRQFEPLHVLYLGRRHPLKGVEYLEQAVHELNDFWRKYQPNAPSPIELRIESSIFGEEKEKAWDWCDVLCLPTLSDNLGLVIAEAIEHGRSVITTDGAPAWEPEGEAVSKEKKSIGTNSQQLTANHSFVYLRGYRDGTDAQRIALLKNALKQYVD